MTRTEPVLVAPGDPPRRVVLLRRDGAHVREVHYLLRVTRAGGLLLNRDDLAPHPIAV